MSIPLITVLSHPDEPGFHRLKQTAEKNGWVLHPIVTEWRGFGTKIIELKKYLEANPEIERFVFCDAYDVVILGSPDEMQTDAKVLFSAEKGCWPVPSMARFYPETESKFKYLNSGLFYAETEAWLKMIEPIPVNYADDDQLFYTNIFFFDENPIQLDYKQQFFNSHSFIDDDEYVYDDYDGRLLVKYLPYDSMELRTRPFAIHFNGRTVDPLFDILL